MQQQQHERANLVLRIMQQSQQQQQVFLNSVPASSMDIEVVESDNYTPPGYGNAGAGNSSAFALTSVPTMALIAPGGRSSGGGRGGRGGRGRGGGGFGIGQTGQFLSAQSTAHTVQARAPTPNMQHQLMAALTTAFVSPQQQQQQQQQHDGNF
jgi:hypothetical protein